MGARRGRSRAKAAVSKQDAREKRVVLLIGVLLFIMLVLWLVFAFSSEAGQAYLKIVQEGKQGNAASTLGVKCIDTDGHNPYYRGRVMYQGKVLKDECQTPQELVEYLCVDNIPSLQFISCTCENGVCKGTVNMGP